MKKHIIFGGFDYAVRYEMNADAIFRGIDYFVDNDPSLIGTTHLGKDIKSPATLLREDKDGILILIGSVVYHTEIEFQLNDMGFEKDKHYVWAIAFNGDSECPRLWKHTQWADDISATAKSAQDEFYLARYKTALRMIDWNYYKTVIDLGSYTQRVRPLLPNNIEYIPVDNVKWTGDTVLLDLNKYEFPFDMNFNGVYNPQYTVILSIGNIQYIRDWKWYIKSASECCTTLVIENNDFVRMNREWRREYWTHNNAVFDHEIILYAQKCGLTLVDAVDFRLKSTLYKFTLTSNKS